MWTLVYITDVHLTLLNRHELLHLVVNLKDKSLKYCLWNLIGSLSTVDLVKFKN
jgi:hypothetical protein